jgi:hypothetical protein
MRSIIPELTDELLAHVGDPAKISEAQPYRVNTFRELVEQTAKLSFKNKDHLLFFRGQEIDHKNKADKSTFYPTIYRGHLLQRELENRFEILERSSKILIELFEKNKIEGYKELKKRKSIQWSILQHYKVCETPFTDFTQSLRVACSFATMGEKGKDAFIYVFGLPYFTNRISHNSEHDIINIRLLSICPPTALRPYFQEGYLVGTDDITTNFENKSDLDFNRRLVAKFVIPNVDSFWGEGFHQIPEDSLKPKNDPILELCNQIKDISVKEFNTGDVGMFLLSWSEFEERLLSQAKKTTEKILSVRESMRELLNRRVISEESFYQFDRMREFRNRLVHTPNKINPYDISKNIANLDELKKALVKQ